jgi:UPF0755 protein
VTAPGRRSRHSDDGAGGVPPFYWVSTGAGAGADPAPYGGERYDTGYQSSGYDTSGYDPAYDSHHDAPRYDSYDAPRYDSYDAPRYDVSAYEGTRFDTTGFEAVRDVPAWGATTGYGEPTTAGMRRVSGVLDRHDLGDPQAERDWWRHRPEHGADDAPPSSGGQTWSSEHPSQPVPSPVPPLPGGAWDRLQGRSDGADDGGATEAHPLLPEVGPGPAARRPGAADETDTGALSLDREAPGWDDRTGGLEVIGANVDEGVRRRGRRWRRGRDERHDEPADLHDEHFDDDFHDEDFHDDDFRDGDFHDEDLHDEVLDAPHPDDEHAFDDDDIPLKPYDRRSARGRRRKRPIALVFSLLVLAGLVAGIVFGGQKLLGVLNPSSQDYSGQGTGSIQIRVQDGDTLSDIARTLVDAGVIASVGPFVDAAEAHPEATSIQPGVYGMREKMSGQAALDRLLEPDARLVSRVTIREGLTAKQTLAALAEATGTPLDQLEAAAQNTAALGLPAWARGNIEGLLFPATYDFEPDTPPADMLRAMVTRANQALDELKVPADKRQRLVTEASIVQAEAASAEDMAKVATVLNNRIADGMPLQLDTTVNYANGKSGITTTPQDRENPSPYNTYRHTGLPPGPISNPGEDALRAVLSPTPGDWRFFVVVNPDTGETRFARTAEEHQQNVLLFQQWLRENPGG